jgi:ADP-heptose:LPS heptosyltransferase
MKRALFTSKNLIGDALYIQPALKAWSQQHPGWAIDLLTLDDHIACLYEGMGIPNLRVVYNDPKNLEQGHIRLDYQDEYDFQHTFNVNAAFTLGHEKKLHISQAYMSLLGLEVPEGLPKVAYTPPQGDAESDLILVSMFSKSCASRSGKAPNKMLGWGHWLSIISILRQLGPVRFLGGPGDEAPLPILKEEYVTGRPLPWVARTMKRAKLLVSIDNGMGHLAATQGLPTILFYPKCLNINWIVPANNKMMLLHMDPTQMTIPDAVTFVRKGLQRLWREE